MRGFIKDKKFHPIRNKRSPSKTRKKRQNFEKPKIQSLIFNKKKFSMSQTKEWAVDHGFKAVKVEPTKNTWRIRQFSPNKIKRGTTCKTIQFGGSGVQGVLCDTPEKFKHDTVELVTRQDVKDQVLSVLKDRDDLTGTDIIKEIESKGFTFNPETRLSVRRVLLKLEEEGKGSFDDRSFTLEKN